MLDQHEVKVSRARRQSAPELLLLPVDVDLVGPLPCFAVMAQVCDQVVFAGGLARAGTACQTQQMGRLPPGCCRYDRWQWLKTSLAKTKLSDTAAISDDYDTDGRSTQLHLRVIRRLTCHFECGA